MISSAEQLGQDNFASVSAEGFQNFVVQVLNEPRDQALFASEYDRRQFITKLTDATKSLTDETINNNADLTLVLSRKGRKSLFGSEAGFDKIARTMAAHFGCRIQGNALNRSFFVSRDGEPNPMSIPFVLSARKGVNHREVEKSPFQAMKEKAKGIFQRKEGPVTPNTQSEGARRNASASVDEYIP